MAELEPNDLFQDRGIIKITDGLSTVDINEDGSLKVDTDNSTFPAPQTDRDTIECLLSDIVTQIKLTNCYLAEMINEKFDADDIEEE